MGKVCKTKNEELAAYFNRQPPAGPERDRARHLNVVTQTFVQMLQHRHTADYDSSVKWSRTDTIEKIESVAAAFESWRTIRNEPLALNFLVTLLLKERRPH
jgi:hypothetical protein